MNKCKHVQFLKAFICSYNHVSRAHTRHPAAVHYWANPTPAQFKTCRVLPHILHGHCHFLKIYLDCIFRPD